MTFERVRTKPLSMDIKTRSASLGTDPFFSWGEINEEIRGALIATMDDPLGVHTGSIHSDGFLEIFFGSSVPSDLIIHK